MKQSIVLLGLIVGLWSGVAEAGCGTVESWYESIRPCVEDNRPSGEKYADRLVEKALSPIEPEGRQAFPTTRYRNGNMEIQRYSDGTTCTSFDVNGQGLIQTTCN